MDTPANGIQTNSVRCPQCGRRHEHMDGNGIIYTCVKCGVHFDNAPDEGGTYSHRNPAARLEREERQREKKLNRLGRRPR